MGPLFQRRCKVLFSHRLDLTLIKLVNDETTLSGNQLIYAFFVSVNYFKAYILAIISIISESFDIFSLRLFDL